MKALRFGNWVWVALPLLALAGIVWAAEQPEPRERVKRQVLIQTDDEGSAYLGVHLSEETERAEGGARVTHVVEDSPAERAGLVEDDVIVRFDGRVIRGPAALTERIHAKHPGDSVAVVVVRDDEEKRIEVELGERSSTAGSLVPLEGLEGLEGYVAPEVDPGMLEKLGKIRELQGWRGHRMLLGDWSKPRLGVQLVETTPELRRYFGGSEDSGVLVSKVLAGTPAQRAGIKVGDLIVSVGGAEVASVDELREALDEKEGESLQIEVIRDRKGITLAVEIDEPERDHPTGPRAALPPPHPAPPAMPAFAPAPPPPPPAAPMAPVAPEAPMAPPPPMAPPAFQPQGRIV